MVAVVSSGTISAGATPDPSAARLAATPREASVTAQRVRPFTTDSPSSRPRAARDVDAPPRAHRADAPIAPTRRRADAPTATSIAQGAPGAHSPFPPPSGAPPALSPESGLAPDGAPPPTAAPGSPPPGAAPVPPPPGQGSQPGPAAYPPPTVPYSPYPYGPYPQPPPPPLAVEPPLDAARAAREANAHADRVVLLPTAYTHPKGTVYVSSYEIIVLQTGWAFSDASQVSVTLTPPFGDDLIFPLDLSLKSAVVRDDLVRVAVIGSATGLVGFEADTLFLGRLGGAVQLCFSRACGSSLSFGGTTVFAGPATVIASGAGGTFPLNDWLTFLLEATTLVPIGREAGQANGAMLTPGMRINWKRFALDLAFGFPSAPVDIPVLPILVATYRFLP